MLPIVTRKKIKQLNKLLIICKGFTFRHTVNDIYSLPFEFSIYYDQLMIHDSRNVLNTI